MLYQKTDSDVYKKQFKKKFENFCTKAPCLLSFIITDKNVQVIHENSETVYSFDWNFAIPIKSFIYEIKQVLLEKHYPRIVKTEEVERPLSTEEQAALIADQVNIDQVPDSVISINKTWFIITRVIVPKDIFIIEDAVTKNKFRYQLKMSSVFFLKNYRTGKYKSPEEAGNWFFKNSTLLNVIDETDAESNHE